MGTFILDTLFEVSLQLVSEEQLALVSKKGPTFLIFAIVTGLTFGGIMVGIDGAFICGGIGMIVGWIYVTLPIFYNHESLYTYMKYKITPGERKMLTERVKKDLEINLKGDISTILPFITIPLREDRKSIIIKSIQNHMINKRNVVKLISKRINYLLV